MSFPDGAFRGIYLDRGVLRFVPRPLERAKTLLYARDGSLLAFPEGTVVLEHPRLGRPHPDGQLNFTFARSAR